MPPEDRMTLATQFAANGFVTLPEPLEQGLIANLRTVLEQQFQVDSPGSLAHSQHGHVYAARNVLSAAPKIKALLSVPQIQRFVRQILGERAGLVRALFFDKPPEQSWSLPWHKDRSIAVARHDVVPTGYSRPTVKRGVPHLIAPDELLKQMLTLRIHLDAMTDDNGPLQVVPGSHHSSDDLGVGVDNRHVIHAAVGEILAMRPLLTHASGLSKPGTTEHRRILHFEFAATEQLASPLQWYEFHHVSQDTTQTVDA